MNIVLTELYPLNRCKPAGLLAAIKQRRFCAVHLTMGMGNDYD